MSCHCLSVSDDLRPISILRRHLQNVGNKKAARGEGGRIWWLCTVWVVAARAKQGRKHQRRSLLAMSRRQTALDTRLWSATAAVTCYLLAALRRWCNRRT